MATLGHILATALPVPDQQPWFEWIRLHIPIVIPSILTAIVVGGFSFLFNRKLEKQRRIYSEEIARLNTDLSRSLQEKLEADRAQRTESLEHLRQGIQESLASRSRRSEYLKAQITNLYGPFAYSLEVSAMRMRCLGQIDNSVKELSQQENSRNTAHFLTKNELEAWLETVARYGDLIHASTDEAAGILREGWSWLDEDDYTNVIQFVTDVERSKTELRTEQGKRLPQKLYSKSALPHSALEVPDVVRPEFAHYMREKLYSKQRELSGLTGKLEPQPLYGPKPLPQKPANMNEGTIAA
ncbi:hypothetical protein ACN47A_06750 [Myxococcus fulvus]|uniref:hypothetical protein n=1 Tax=Myxococcus fulvus TaxID=33 RepID=UPI003B99D00B